MLDFLAVNPGFAEEFPVEPGYDLVGLDRPDEAGQGFHFDLEQFTPLFCAGGAGIPPIVGRKVGLPTDPAEISGHILQSLERSGQLSRYAVHVDELGIGSQGDAGFAFAGMPVLFGFQNCIPTLAQLWGERISRPAEQVETVGSLLPTAGLRQEAQHGIVAAVPVEQDDLLETVARDLSQHPLEQLDQQGGAQGQRAGEAARFVDLPEIKLREYDRRLRLRGPAGDGVRIQHIRPKRQMLAVPLQDAQGQDTHAGILNGAG